MLASWHTFILILASASYNKKRLSKISCFNDLRNLRSPNGLSVTSWSRVNVTRRCEACNTPATRRVTHLPVDFAVKMGVYERGIADCREEAAAEAVQLRQAGAGCRAGDLE